MALEADGLMRVISGIGKPKIARACKANSDISVEKALEKVERAYAKLDVKL